MIYLQLELTKCVAELKKDPNRIVMWMEEIKRAADLMKRNKKSAEEIKAYLEKNRAVLLLLKHRGYQSMVKPIARLDLMLSKI